MKSKALIFLGFFSFMSCSGSVPSSGIGSHVFIVERASESLAVYDLLKRELLPDRISGLGNLRHATMIFSPDLHYAYLATRNGKVSRIDLATLKKDKEVFSSQNSIDNAISHDGKYIAVGEYVPGGLSILDAQTLKVLKKYAGDYTYDGKTLNSRVTGVVDAPGNRFVCVLIEGAEIWIIDANSPDFKILHKIPTPKEEPYDAMITADGKYYLVGHLKSNRISVLDLENPEKGTREITLNDPHKIYDKSIPVKLPHMASWAIAGNYAFVPLVGESRLAVLDRKTWNFVDSIDLRGHPVYAVRSPSEREVWVSFSGLENDSYVQIINVDTLKVIDEIKVGGKIYHMDFTPRGSHVLVSANRDNKFFLINAQSRKIEDTENVDSPSGIFGVWRAFKLGL